MDNEEGGKIIRKDRVGVEKVMGYKIQLWESLSSKYESVLKKVSSL